MSVDTWIREKVLLTMNYYSQSATLILHKDAHFIPRLT